MALNQSRPFRLPDPLLLVLFLLVGIGGCLDFGISFLPLVSVADTHLYVCYVVMGLLLLADCEGSLRPRLAVTLSGLLLTILYVCVMRHAAHHYSLHVLTRLVLRSPAIYLWTVALWFASPILLNRGPGRASRGFRYAVLALCLFGGLCFSSAATSSSPKHSLSLFFQERAVLLGVLFPWLRAARHSDWLRKRTGRWMLCFFGVMVLLAAFFSLAYVLGGQPLRDRLHGLGVVYVAPGNADPTLPKQRLLFPLLHFNRTALFMLAAAMFMIVSYFSVPRGRLASRLSLILAFLSMILLIQTYTRGAIVAALVGICLLGCLLSRRMLLALLIGSVLLITFMPANQRSHILSIFEVSTYTSQERKTSMGDRILVWKWGVRKIAEHPWTGLGYGARIIRKAYQKYAREIKDPRLIQDLEGGVEMQHLHNTVLEIAAESGLPALLAFIAFTALRWLMLLRSFRGSTGQERARAGAWIAFECALLIYCMIFYMLRRNFGFLTWFVWIYILAETEARLRKPLGLPVGESPSTSR